VWHQTNSEMAEVKHSAIVRPSDGMATNRGEAACQHIAASNLGPRRCLPKETVESNRIAVPVQGEALTDGKKLCFS